MSDTDLREASEKETIHTLTELNEQLELEVNELWEKGEKLEVEANQKVDQLSKGIKDAKQKIATLEQEKSQLAAEEASKKKGRKERAIERKNLIKEKQQKIDGLTKVLNGFERSYEAEKGKAEKLTATNSRLKERIASLKEEINTKTKSQEKTKTRLQEEIRRKEKMISEAQKNLDDTRNQVSIARDSNLRTISKLEFQVDKAIKKEENVIREFSMAAVGTLGQLMQNPAQIAQSSDAEFQRVSHERDQYQFLSLALTKTGQAAAGKIDDLLRGIKDTETNQEIAESLEEIKTMLLNPVETYQQLKEQDAGS